MLLIDSMARLALRRGSPAGGLPRGRLFLPAPATPCGFGGGRSAASVDRRDVLPHNVAVGLEPLGGFLELAALDGPDLNPAAALVVLWGNVEGRNEPIEGEVFDLLHALLDILAGWLGAALGLDGVADRFEMDGCLEHSAVVD